MARTLELRKVSESYGQAVRLLEAIPQAERDNLVLGGGLAVEFWTGGTGTRHEIGDIDLISRVRLSGQDALTPLNLVRKWTGKLEESPFHNHALRLADALEPRFGTAHGYATETFSRWTFASLPIQMELLTPDVFGGFSFLPGQAHDSELHAETRSGSRSIASIRIAAVPVLIWAKLSQSRVMNAAKGDDKGLKDCVDVVALLCTTRRSELNNWIDRGVPEIQVHTSQIPAVAASKPSLPFESFAMQLRDEEFAHTIRERVMEKFPEASSYVSDAAIQTASSRLIDFEERFTVRLLEGHLVAGIE